MNASEMLIAEAHRRGWAAYTFSGRPVLRVGETDVTGCCLRATFVVNERILFVERETYLFKKGSMVSKRTDFVSRLGPFWGRGWVTRAADAFAAVLVSP